MNNILIDFIWKYIIIYVYIVNIDIKNIKYEKKEFKC